MRNKPNLFNHRYAPGGLWLEDIDSELYKTIFGAGEK